MKFEIGDGFKIVIFYDKCLFKNNIYFIKSFSKSLLSVYYEYKKTNRKCRCRNCTNYNDNNDKCIGISNIELAYKATQIKRDRIINRLLKK